MAPEPLLSLVCEKCRTTYHVGVDSFMKGSTRSLDSLFGGGASEAASREYTVGELREFSLADLRAKLSTATIAAVDEAVEGIRRGQELTWICRNCEHSTNNFPSSLYDSVALPKDWPYPSDGFFRNASKALVASHGPVVRVKLDTDTFLLTYQDGHEVLAGYPGIYESVKVDINLFALGSGEGRRFTEVFFAAAGIKVPAHDIFGQSNRGTYTVNDGALVNIWG